jgi:hypothetical protein
VETGGVPMVVLAREIEQFIAAHADPQAR